MNASDRAALAAVPVPIEAGVPVAACVVGAPGGTRVAWMHDGGRRKEPFGPVYFAARDATAAARWLNARDAAL